jgi:hypothetical protein
LKERDLEYDETASKLIIATIVLNIFAFLAIVASIGICVYAEFVFVPHSRRPSSDDKEIQMDERNIKNNKQMAEESGWIVVKDDDVEWNMK